jgi:prepilin-type N-terminal cleavage/methylation domain-containing protein
MVRWLRREERGFTLIEMMVVLAIIALVAVFAIPNIAQALANGRIRTVEAQARQIQVAFDEYYHDNVKYPVSADQPQTTGVYSFLFGSGGALTQYVSLPQIEDQALFVANCYNYDNSAQAKYVLNITARNVTTAERNFIITKNSVTRSSAAPDCTTIP